MVDQVARGSPTHGVEHNIDSFASGEFRRRNKIPIASDENDLIDLVLKGHCRHIQPQSHIHTPLHDGQLKVVVRRNKGLRREPFC